MRVRSGNVETRARSAQCSVEMLRAVLDGATYQMVALDHGVTRTAVERRIKSTALQLTRTVGVDGLRAEGAAFVSRLRHHREAILSALERFEPGRPVVGREARALTPDEVAQGATRIRGRALRTWHDLSLYYLLFATGLRPLEIARLQVRDYLEADGHVRGVSELRAAAALQGQDRPLHFDSTLLNEAMDAYLLERQKLGHGSGRPVLYRGLDPHSPLFLNVDGAPYAILPNGRGAQQRFVCRELLEVFRRLFRQAEIAGLSTRTARLTLMVWLHQRGADPEQIGALLGIRDSAAVRQMLPRTRRTLPELMRQVL